MPSSHFHVVLDQMAEGLACGRLVEGPDFEILEVNPAFATLTGCVDPVGRRLRALAPALDARDAPLLARLARVAATGVADRFEGEIAALGVTVALAAYGAEPGHVVIVFRIVREGRLAALLDDRDANLRSVMASMAEGMVVHDAAGTIVSCNASAERILGLTRAQLEGRTSIDPRWQTIHADGSPFPGDDHPAMITLRTGLPLRDVVMGVDLPDGDRRWISIATEPVRDGLDPRPRAVVATFTDITNPRRVEQAQREREAWLRAIYEGSPVGIVRTDPAGVVLDANPAFVALVGYPLDELVGLPIARLAHPEHAAADADARRALPEAGVERETRWMRKDGASRWIALRVRPVRDDAGCVTFHFGLALDITERRRVEAELQRVLREQEVILEQVGVGILVSVDRRQLRVNRWIETTFGFTREELLGRSTRMLYGSDQAYVAAGRGFDADLRAEGRCEAELTLHRRDGVALCIHATGRLLEPGDPAAGTLWVLMDRTAERAAEEALRRSEQRFRTLFEGHSAMMLLVDPTTGAIVDVTPAAAAFYGYPRATLRTMNIRQVNALTPDELASALARATSGARTAFIVPHRLADGRICQVELNSSVVEIDGRRLLFSVVQDVTERARISAALDRERQRYLSFMTIAQDGIHVLDEAGRLIDANPAFLAMLGRDADAIGHLHVAEWDATIPADQLPGRIGALMAAPQLFATRHRRADGTTFDVEIQAGGVVLEGQRYLLAAARDVSARLAAERQRQRHHAELEALNATLEERVRTAVAELRTRDQLLIGQSRQAAMGEMIGNIAHQWRQPLNALGLVLANLRDAARFDELDRATAERAVADANRLIQGMSTTINVFRDFFRPEKRPGAFSARAEVEETIRLVDAVFQDVGIACEVVPGPDLPLFGIANEYAQVLLNLLTNARQAIQAARVPAGRVTIRLEARAGRGILAVRDNGGGVPIGLLDRIFEPYFSTREGGTGIGLYMSRQIVERSMGGAITVANVDGGAEFRIVTPLAE